MVQSTDGGTVVDEEARRGEAPAEEPNPEPTESAQTNWRHFRLAYPWHSLLDEGATREVFLGLSPRDQRKAIRWGGQVRADKERLKRDKVPDPIKGLRSHSFADFSEFADDVARAAGLSGAPVYVAQGSPSWDACAAWYRRKHGKFPPTGLCKDPENRGRTGWYFPREAFRKQGDDGPPADVSAA